MIKKIFRALTSALRQLLRRWGSLTIMFVLYLAMIGAVYLFFVTREATIGELILSLLLALAAPILFLIIQTMAARYGSTDDSALRLLGKSARDFWKLLVIALPLIALAVVVIYLLGIAEPHTPAAAVREAVRAAPARPVAPKPQPVRWPVVAITTLEYLLYFLVFPLAAVQLWLATAREGLKRAFKASFRIVGRAFAPASVICYAIGFVFFAVVPYFLIVTKTPAGSAWLDAGLLVARLVLAAVFSLVAWVATVGALGELSGDRIAGAVSQPSEGARHVPAQA